MMTTVPHVTSGSGLRKFQADRFLFDRVYIFLYYCKKPFDGPLWPTHAAYCKKQILSNKLYLTVL